MVEFAPNENVGVFVEAIAVLALPENPAVFAVLNVPFIVTVAEVPNATMLVPAVIVAPDATVKVFEFASVTLKLPVFNKPLATLRFPVTFDAVMAAPSVAPLTFVLLKLKLAYVIALTPIGTN